MNFGDCDCSLPILEAEVRQLDIDVFIIYTDNNTHGPSMHPFKAIQRYREKMNKPDAKLIVCAMESNGFSIVDPNDRGMLDIVGFDTSVPDIIFNFVMGRF